MTTGKALNLQRDLLLLAEEATSSVVDEIIALLPSWHCHTVYDWQISAHSGSGKTSNKTGIKEQPSSVTTPTFTLREEIPSVGLFALSAHPDNYTIERLEQIVNTTNSIPWVAVLADEHFSNRKLMALVTTYCRDYISYPVSGLKNTLTSILGHIAGMTQLRIEQQKILSNYPVQTDSNHQYGMTGSSPPMQAVFRLISKYAATDAPVTISGESGTGKELVARAIHLQSKRAGEPFVAVNCGAIPENLLESELFGHIKGAFTGAIGHRDGRITLADGGTLFLDEIGDLSLHQQVKILRFIQEGTFEPVGSSKTQQVDVRIITASHIDLQQAVQAQKFREDLYYRLNVLQLSVPALRTRGADIELLADDYLSKFAAGRTIIPKGFSKAAKQALVLHQWPGNVRELINRIRKAAIVCEDSLIEPEDLDLNAPPDSNNVVVNLQDARSQAEVEALQKALDDTQFNVSKAAELLGISRMTIYRLMEKHNIHY